MVHEDIIGGDIIVNEEPLVSTPALYVSTTLHYWFTERGEQFTEDFTWEGTAYRRLSPRYYAWLKYKYNAARKLAIRGLLAKEAMQTLRERFEYIHTWAVEHFGEDLLRAAETILDPKEYIPPSVDAMSDDDTGAAESVDDLIYSGAHRYPVGGDFPFLYDVSPEAIAKVDAIKDQAVSLGWMEAYLYQNRSQLAYPHGPDYGLVCFIDEDEQVGEITPQYIEIIGPPPRKYRLRFSRPGG